MDSISDSVLFGSASKDHDRYESIEGWGEEGGEFKYEILNLIIILRLAKYFHKSNNVCPGVVNCLCCFIIEYSMLLQRYKM